MVEVGSVRRPSGRRRGFESLLLCGAVVQKCTQHPIVLGPMPKGDGSPSALGARWWVQSIGAPSYFFGGAKPKWEGRTIRTGVPIAMAANTIAANDGKVGVVCARAALDRVVASPGRSRLAGTLTGCARLGAALHAALHAGHAFEPVVGQG